MSKQSDAKIAQAYDDKPLPPVCSNCRHFTSELKLPAWMREVNEESKKPRYTLEEHGLVGSMQCGIGGFAVKKTATCQLFQWKDVKA